MATPSTGGGTTFPVVYVVLGGAALLSTVIFPISFIVALRYYRRRSRFLDQQLPLASGAAYGGYIQQVEPKLFDVYVKPGLELHEPRFEYMLPMAVRIEPKSSAPPATSASSSAPSVPRTHRSSRSQEKEDDKAEALAQEDAFQTYDVAALVVMPHPHPADSWGELGEYAIGTTKFVSSVSSDDSSLFGH